MAFQCRRDRDRLGIVKRPPHHLNADRQPVPGQAAARHGGQPKQGHRPAAALHLRPAQHLIANPEFGRAWREGRTEATGMSRIGDCRMNAATSARRSSAAVVSSRSVADPAGRPGSA